MARLQTMSLGSLTAKKMRYVLLFIGVVAAIAFLPIFTDSAHAQGGGGIGDGGTGSGGGGGHQSTYGYGWVNYWTLGPGPTDGFRDGTSWASVRDTCLAAGAIDVFAFIVREADGSGRVYKYQGWNNPANLFPVPSRVDNDAAGTMTSQMAEAAFYDLPNHGVSTFGFTWGVNVAWFCSNFIPPVSDYRDAVCAIFGSPATITQGRQFQVYIHFANTGNMWWYPSQGYAIGSQNPENNGTWGVARLPIGGDIAPGTTSFGPPGSGGGPYTFTAPSTPGTYTFSWRMLQEGVTWFGQTCTTTITVTPPSTRDAVCAMYGVPSVILPGQVFQAYIHFANTGDVTWDPAQAYSIGSQNPENNGTWGMGRLPIAGVIPPGGISYGPPFSNGGPYTFTAPTTEGVHAFSWRMVQDGVTWFGQTCTQYVTVRHVHQAQCVGIQFISGPVLESDGRRYIEPGRPLRAQVTMRNLGTETWFTGRNINLGSESGRDNVTWGLGRVALPYNVAPGGTATFDFTATSPNPGPISGPRMFEFDWAMVNDGRPGDIGWYGVFPSNICQADVYVTERYDVQPPTASTGQSSFIPGVTSFFDINVTAINSGLGDAYFAGSAAGRGVVDFELSYTRNGAPIPGGLSMISGDILDRRLFGRGAFFSAVPPVLRISLSGPPASFTLGDELCVLVVAHYTQGWEGGPSPADVVRGGGGRACIRAAERPFIEVEGAGVWAGGEFDTANVFGNGWCTMSGGASTGFIRAALMGTVGSFAEYATVATGVVTGFGSTLRPGADYKSSYLHFANTPASGAYNSAGKCITDYYSYLDKTNPTFTFPASDGQYFKGGSGMTIGGQTLGQGSGPRKVTLIVEGDVTINNNIMYDPAYSVADPSDIPIFILIASGNINITGNVTELNGIYISQGANGINTCSDGPARLTATDCTQSLKIKGAFVANDIEFRRTHGGVLRTPSVGEGAERFEFGPDIFLARPYFESELEPDIRSSLIRDLPPVN